jgi:hypothetical protein
MFRSQLWWLLTISVLLVIPVFAPLATLAYDVHDNYHLANDGRCESAGGYDAILEHSTSETRTGTTGYWALVAEFDKILAAKTAPANAFTRTHGLSGRASSRNVNEIADSMRANGWQGDPIKVLDHNGTKYILDGHHRVEAARRVGIEVPYQTVAPENLSQFGYKSVEQVIQATSEAGPVRLR